MVAEAAGYLPTRCRVQRQALFRAVDSWLERAFSCPDLLIVSEHVERAVREREPWMQRSTGECSQSDAIGRGRRSLNRSRLVTNSPSVSSLWGLHKTACEFAANHSPLGPSGLCRCDRHRSEVRVALVLLVKRKPTVGNERSGTRYPQWPAQRSREGRRVEIEDLVAARPRACSVRSGPPVAHSAVSADICGTSGLNGGLP